jgi:HAD superfamily phosphatase (TIGR01668 family)
VSWIFRRFFPRLFVEDVGSIDLEKLKRLGIRGLVVDLDNTLVAWSAYEVPLEVTEWIKTAKNLGFSICIVSNALEDRVAYFSKLFAIPGISRAQKPRRGAFRSALEALGLKKEEVAVIGDQVFTDVWGGNRLGLYTILVRPVSPREFFTTKIGRVLERWVLRRFKPGD